MTIITPKQQKIVSIILKRGFLSSSIIHEEIISSGENLSLVTVKRALSEMTEKGILSLTGSGRSVKYEVSMIGRVFSDINAKEYCAVEPDKRYGTNKYNFDLFSSFPSDIFLDNELKSLSDATHEFKRRSKNLPSAIEKKELERLIIELSWKSSKIEGNTYTLLDTEKLILENKEAPGHSKKEAQMILNHKDAFNFVRENATDFKTLTRKNLEELHTILVRNLSIGSGLRKKPVGVVGSIYRPLDNVHQIREAVDMLGETVNRISTPYGKALIALLGISYIQPFEDGNKRTARLMANALLIAYQYSPLSYRSVDENEYREAMLAFYEINSIVPLKKIFINQYIFATKNYAA